MDWIVSPRLFCWSPNSQHDGIWRWGLRRQLGLGEVRGDISALTEETPESLLPLSACTQRGGHVRTQKWQWPAGQEGSPQQTPALLAPWSRTPSLQRGENAHVAVHAPGRWVCPSNPSWRMQWLWLWRVWCGGFAECPTVWICLVSSSGIGSRCCGRMTSELFDVLS